MKKIINVILVVTILINSYTVVYGDTQADLRDESLYDVDEYYKKVYTMYHEFMTGGSWNNYLINDKNFVFPQVKDQLENNKYFQSCLSVTEILTEANWVDIFMNEYDENDVKVQYYVTALSSLLMTIESNWTDIKAKQEEVDATMTWRDYFVDGANIITGAISEDIDGKLGAAFTACDISIDVLGTSIDSLEDYQMLEANASTYLMYRSLLEVIIKNTTDSLLIQAAHYLLKITDLCYIYQMEHIDEIISKEADIFFSVLDKVIEQEKEDSSLLSDEWAALSILNYAVKNIGYFNLGVDFGKFICDVFIKSSDTILRYYEMCTLTSVRRALIIEINDRNLDNSGQQDWKKILDIRDLLISLVYVNVRGEYCVYSLLKEDAGLYSRVHVWLNGEKNEKWFDSVLNIANYLQRNMEDFSPDWEQYKKMNRLSLKDKSLLAQLPYIGESSQCSMSSEQAEAYLQIIENAQRHLTSMESSYTDVDSREVYATLFGDNGNVSLWIVGIEITNREKMWPNDIQFGNNQVFRIEFEEIWEWNSTTATKFSIVSDYNAHVNLRPNGLEVFINYNGLDADGEAWNAFYPFMDGKISTIPSWCRAWTWIYDYKLEDINTNTMDKKDVTQKYFDNLFNKKKWPSLFFDWNTFTISYDMYDAFRATVSFGDGFQNIYIYNEYEPGGYCWPYCSGTPGVILCAADIAKQDERWGKVETEYMSYDQREEIKTDVNVSEKLSYVK